MPQIGKNIKKIRTVKGLSQQAFADLFSLTRGNISSYEEFRAEPKIEVIIRIANFFGIPLEDFISKDLSVNELLHYNSSVVLETDKLKMSHPFLHIRYVPAFYQEEYARHYEEKEFTETLPQIVLPGNSRFPLIAFEIANQENLPAGFNYHNGDILIFEKVVKENLHRILGKLGIRIDREGVKAGVFNEKDNEISLILNEWVSYPFEIETNAQYWVLRGLYTQIL